MLKKKKAYNQRILIYDSGCNLCRHIIRFVQRYERKPCITYVPNNSSEARDLAKDFGLDLNLLKSVILVSKGRIYSKSTAALRVTLCLKGVWPLLSLFLAIPRPVRDFVYDVIARNRYGWFGRCENCTPL